MDHEWRHLWKIGIFHCHVKFIAGYLEAFGGSNNRKSNTLGLVTGVSPKVTLETKPFDVDGNGMLMMMMVHVWKWIKHLMNVTKMKVSENMMNNTMNIMVHSDP